MTTETLQDAQQQALEELSQEFLLSSQQLKDIAKHFKDEMEHGLQSDDASVPMLPSWITRHPTGQETGEYLGLEVSGSVVRIYLVDLLGQGKIKIRHQTKIHIHDDLKKGPVSQLIDFLAASVDRFVAPFNIHGPPMALGFVISFPLQQTALNRGSVIQWTKDFEISGADRKNLVDLLQTALRKLQTPVVVEAIMNSAVACLLAHSYRSLDTLLACTVSTGTNAAYWEKLSECSKISGTQEEEMIINTEWGSFGDKNPKLLPRTVYDNRLNRESWNAGVHIFEKMVSGLYLGELVRNVIIDFVDRRLLFNGNSSKELNQAYFFETSYMSTIESDSTTQLEETQHILEAVLNLPPTTIEDRRVVKKICELVGQRAAQLIAASMSAVLYKRNALEDNVTLSVEGSIYEHYPNFPNRVNAALREMFGQAVDQINIGSTRDSHGTGAALAAMIARTSK
ncbi:hypothetical protein VTP01DRAFT_66 [Rhizomucor pusillus]|uniref:uncharacterized protein n=1 Tax=Rhizomucor pusillus TaxID=4840 RepID=UPI003744781F